MKKRIMSLLLVVLLVFTAIPVFAIGRTAKLVSFKGNVKVQRLASHKKFKAFKNMTLSEGDALMTGKKSKAVLDFGTKNELIIAANTKISIAKMKKSAKSEETFITLHSGGVGNKVRTKLKKGSSYKIKTPTAVMGVRGTEFYVQVEGGKLDVWLSEGVIEMEYMADGNILKSLNKDEGDKKTMTLTAPVRFSLPAPEQTIDTNTQEFDLEGLYEEFLEQENFGKLGFTESEIKTARENAKSQKENNNQFEESQNQDFIDFTYRDGHIEKSNTTDDKDENNYKDYDDDDDDYTILCNEVFSGGVILDTNVYVEYDPNLTPLGYVAYYNGMTGYFSENDLQLGYITALEVQ